jgi:hypothetical protein
VRPDQRAFRLHRSFRGSGSSEAESPADRSLRRIRGLAHSTAPGSNNSARLLMPTRYTHIPHWQNGQFRTKIAWHIFPMYLQGPLGPLSPFWVASGPRLRSSDEVPNQICSTLRLCVLTGAELRSLISVWLRFRLFSLALSSRSALTQLIEEC